jgi:hypothetical protein
MPEKSALSSWAFRTLPGNERPIRAPVLIAPCLLLASLGSLHRLFDLLLQIGNGKPCCIGG